MAVPYLNSFFTSPKLSINTFSVASELKEGVAPFMGVSFKKTSVKASRLKLSVPTPQLPGCCEGYLAANNAFLTAFAGPAISPSESASKIVKN